MNGERFFSLAPSKLSQPVKCLTETILDHPPYGEARTYSKFSLFFIIPIKTKQLEG